MRWSAMKWKRPLPAETTALEMALNSNDDTSAVVDVHVAAVAVGESGDREPPCESRHQACYG